MTNNTIYLIITAIITGVSVILLGTLKKIFNPDGSISWIWLLISILVLDLIIISVMIKISEDKQKGKFILPKEAFSSKSKKFKVLVLPFEDLTTNNSKIAILVKDKLYELNEKDELGIDIYYYDKKLNPNYTDEDFHHILTSNDLDLIIWGKVISGGRLDSLNVNLRYIFNQQLAKGDLSSGLTNNYQKVNVLDFAKGAFQENIHVVLYAVSGIISAQNYNPEESLKKSRIRKIM